MGNVVMSTSKPLFQAKNKNEKYAFHAFSS